MNYQSNSGIAIAPILFIVALLAILGAAIAAGAGWLTGGTSNENASSQATAIIHEAEILQQGVQRVIDENGCADFQISFSNPIITKVDGSDVYTNSNAPANGSCNVFSLTGGGINFPMVTASAVETTDAAHFIFEGSMNFVGLGNPYSNPYPAPSSSLAAFLPVDSLAVCRAINTAVGQSGQLGWGFYWNPTDATAGHFVGAYFSYNSLPDAGGTWPKGQMMGCMQQGNGGTSPNHTSNWYPYYAPYFFYVVLMVR